jgi:hypothetical protein
MEGAKRVTVIDKTRAIEGVRPIGLGMLHLTWTDGTATDLDLSGVLQNRAYAALRDPAEFSKVEVGDWGHSLAWPSGADIGADTLWLETLSAIGHADTRSFLEWRLRHALSLSRAAEALGLSRRMVAYYSNGEKRVPKSILLACRGWEVVGAERPQAA